LQFNINSQLLMEPTEIQTAVQRKTKEHVKAQCGEPNSVDTASMVSMYRRTSSGLEKSRHFYK
jgi:hypothetical protein